jgi:putative protein kinase ArgK-like GTPase of G3E family
LEKRRKSQIKEELQQCIESEISDILWQDMIQNGTIDQFVADIWRHKISPHNAARKIIADWLGKEKIVK